jgi:hypothetical protein
VARILRIPLKEVHESPYRIISGGSETEIRVATIVHFKQRLRNVRLTTLDDLSGHFSCGAGSDVSAKPASKRLPTAAS